MKLHFVPHRVGNLNCACLRHISRLFAISCASILLLYPSANAQRFLVAKRYPAGNGPNAVAVGDFNGDGKLDLIVGDSADFLGGRGQTGISVLLGNGDGTFQKPTTLITNFDPGSLVVRDFDGDGKLDVAATNETGVVVLFGKGDGTFKPLEEVISFGVFLATSMAAGDFDHDGNLDLAVADFGDSGNGKVFILLGNGHGKFKSAVPYDAGGVGTEHIAVGDFKHSGNLDIAVANSGTTFQGGGNLTVLQGKGDGTFQLATMPINSQNTTFVEVADVNADGLPDLIAPYDTGPIAVYLGKGDGTFQPPTVFQADASGQVLVQDFNGDGMLDLAAINSGGTVSLLFGSGKGSFVRASRYVYGVNGGSAAAGDFNGDGKPDIAVGNVEETTISVLLNNGDGSLQAAKAYFPPGSDSVAIGDFNGDGVPDLAVGHIFCFESFTCSGVDGVSILLGLGSGDFGPPTNFPVGPMGPIPTSVVVGDFNNDGKLDLAVTIVLETTPLFTGGALSVLLGNGDGTFQSPIQTAVGNVPTSAAVGDFNGDGNLDLAVTNSNDNTVTILLGNGNGTFETAETMVTGTAPFFVVNGSFRHSGGNDRHSGGNDIAVANCGAIECNPENSNNQGSLSVLLGNGNGSFQSSLNLPFPSSPNSVAVGDFNRDGKLDLAVANFGSDITVLLGRGDGTFVTPPVAYPIGLNAFALVAGDFNGDGSLDLLAATSGLASNEFGDLSLITGNGDGTFRKPTQFVGGTIGIGELFSFASIAVSDLNSDGAQDLAVIVQSGVSVVLNTGGTIITVTASDTVSSTKPVTLTATVKQSVKGSGTPTGTVTFEDNSAFPTATLGSAKLVAGVATFPAAHLTAGTHLISASYGGDANFNPHSSPELKLMVNGSNGEGGGKGGDGGGGGQCSAPASRTQSIHDKRTIRFVGTSKVEKGETTAWQAAPLDVYARIRMELELQKPRFSRPARGDIASLATSPQPIMGKDPSFFGFIGLNHQDSLQADHGNQTSVEPPDQALAVSSTQVLEAVNDAVAVYGKTGARLAGPISLNLFFKREPAKLQGPPKLFGPFLTDPRALYDEDTKRWFVTALLIDTESSTGNFLPHSEVLLAVSDTSDATGSFTQYSIDVTDSDSPECPCVGDQPLLGINEDGIYITTDQFAFSDFGFKTVLVLAIDKFSLAQGTSLRAVSLKTLPQDEAPGFAIQPAITLNRRHAVPNHGTEYLMSSLDFSGKGDNQLSIWALMNTESLRTAQPDLRILKAEVNTETYAAPPPATQKDGHTPLRDALNASGGNEKLETLETDDDRLQQLYMVEDRLFTALTTTVIGAGGTPHSGIAWFVLNPNANSCSVTADVDRQGYVTATNADIMFPAVAVNRKGSGVIAFSLAGLKNFPSSGYLRLGRQGIVRGIHLDSVGANPEDGFSGYSAFGGNGAARWGDYSAAAVGPDGDLWFASEYVPNQPRTPLANWGTFVGNLDTH